MNDKKEKANLIMKLLKDDKKVLGDLYDLLSLDVYAFALSIVKSSYLAEDIMQEVFIRIYRNAKSYEDKGIAIAWILRITRNIAYDMLKKHKKLGKELKGDEILVKGVIEGFESKSVNSLLVQEMLNLLNKNQSEVIVLHLFSQLPHTEIAKIQGVSLPTVKWRYKTAKMKLKKIMAVEKEVY